MGIFMGNSLVSGRVRDIPTTTWKYVRFWVHQPAMAQAPGTAHFSAGWELGNFQTFIVLQGRGWGTLGNPEDFCLGKIGEA